MKIAIVGGGMAGCALAYVLKKTGLDPVVYEGGPTLASGASGNEAGLYNPRFSAQRTAESDYYSSAFALALQTFKELGEVDWDPCGALHLMNDDKKRKRFGQAVVNWDWDKDHMSLVGMDEASEIAGIDIRHEALYLPQSGSVSPKKLCEAYMRDIDFHVNKKISSVEELEADIVVLANGPAVKDFYPDLPINAVRGQVTSVKMSEYSRDLRCAVCYGGYFSRASDGVHIVGSTFQRWLDHSEVLDHDDEDNLKKLADGIPGMDMGLQIVGRRASLRATARDFFPIVGPAPGAENVYISAAHGSHGILSTLMAAHLLADMILERPLCLGNHTVAELSPERFQ